MMHTLYSFLIFVATVSALWPLPRVYEHGSTVLWLSSDIRYIYKPLKSLPYGHNWMWITSILSYQKLLSLRLNGFTTNRDSHNLQSEPLITSAFERMKYNVVSQNFKPRKFHPRNFTFEPDFTGSKIFIESIVIIKVSELELEALDQVQKSEAYTLSIKSDGTVEIKITSVQGRIQVLETFSQLFFAHSKSASEVYTPYAPLSIISDPSFEHRGLNLDISRNWISPEDVMRTIESTFICTHPMPSSRSP